MSCSNHTVFIRHARNRTNTNLKVFPNFTHPSSYVKISSGIAVESIALYNVEMKLLKEKKIDQQSAEIDYFIPSLSEGIYFIEVSLENGIREVKKIIIRQ